MPLNDLKILGVDARQTQGGGGTEYTVRYRVPKGRVQTEQPYYRRALTNVYPFAADWDPLPPCVDRYELRPQGAGEWWELVCVYRRPTMDMILQPGRGWFYVDSYATTNTSGVPARTEETEVQQSFTDYLRESGQSLSPEYGPGMEELSPEYQGWLADKMTKARAEGKLSNVQVGTQQVPQVIARGTLVIMTCDWFTELWDLMQRATQWVGKGGDPIKIGAVEFQGPKLSAVRVGLRESDASVVECTYKFSLRNTEWPVIQQSFVDWLTTNKVRISDEYAGGAGDMQRSPQYRAWFSAKMARARQRKNQWPLVGQVEYASIGAQSGGTGFITQMAHADAEAVTGYVDFGDAWNDYFTWIPSTNLAEYRDKLGITRRVADPKSDVEMGSVVEITLTEAQKEGYGII